MDIDLRRVILETAAAAPADVRTVAKVVRGEEVRGHVGDRVRRELAARGVTPPAGPAGTSAGTSA